MHLTEKLELMLEAGSPVRWLSPGVAESDGT